MRNGLSVNDDKIIEGVQHRVTKKVTELSGMDARLKNLVIMMLRTRRKRDNLIQIFKIVKGLEEDYLGVKIGEKVF